MQRPFDGVPFQRIFCCLVHFLFQQSSSSWGRNLIPILVHCTAPRKAELSECAAHQAAKQSLYRQSGCCESGAIRHFNVFLALRQRNRSLVTVDQFAFGPPIPTVFSISHQDWNEGDSPHENDVALLLALFDF